MEKSNEMIELEKKYNKVLENRNKCCKNWRNKGFRPKVMPKTRFF